MTDNTVPAVPTKQPFLSDVTYDRLKWVALVGLPALGTFYFGLAQIWGFPKAEEVLGTILTVDAFLGALLGVAKKSYDKSDARYDGALNVMENDNSMINKLEINTPPEEIGTKDSITLKVNQVPPQ